MDYGRQTEDPHHVQTTAQQRAPPRQNRPLLSMIPRWKDLPPNQREELLRILGRMLAEQIEQAAVVREASHEPR